MRANFEAGHVCWDDRDVMGSRPTGAVRASFGYASSLADAAAIVALVERYFVERRPELVTAAAAEGRQAAEAVAAAGPAPELAGEPADAAPAAEAAWAAAVPEEGKPAASEPAAAGEAASELAAAEPAAAGEAGVIDSLWVYPIKSCRGFSPTAWPLGEPLPLCTPCYMRLFFAGLVLCLVAKPSRCACCCSLQACQVAAHAPV